MTLFPTTSPTFPTPHPYPHHTHIATKYRKIPGASRQHTYREPGQPEAALGPASCPSSELDWDSEQMWWQRSQGGSLLKTTGLIPEWVGAGGGLGRSLASLHQPFLEAPPVAGWELPSPPQERRGLSTENSELQADGSNANWGEESHGPSLPVASWSEQS